VSPAGSNYAADGSGVGIELLSPAWRGVNLDELPLADDVERVMRARGFPILQRMS
jgi:hypothetical protein